MSLRSFNYLLKAIILVILVFFFMKSIFGIESLKIDFQAVLKPLLKIFQKSQKSDRLTSEDYMSFLLGDKPISQIEVEKIATDLLSVDGKNLDPEKNSRLIKIACSLGPWVWKHGSKLFKVTNGDVEINVDPSDFSSISSSLNADLDADTLADILKNMNK